MARALLWHAPTMATALWHVVWPERRALVVPNTHSQTIAFGDCTRGTAVQQLQILLAAWHGPADTCCALTVRGKYVHL